MSSDLEERSLLQTVVKTEHLEFPTRVYARDNGAILLHQDNDPEEMEAVLLDRNTAHALFLLLKNRFEVN